MTYASQAGSITNTLRGEIQTEQKRQRGKLKFKCVTTSTVSLVLYKAQKSTGKCCTSCSLAEVAVTRQPTDNPKSLGTYGKELGLQATRIRTVGNGTVDTQHSLADATTSLASLESAAHMGAGQSRPSCTGTANTCPQPLPACAPLHPSSNLGNAFSQIK